MNDEQNRQNKSDIQKGKKRLAAVVRAIIAAGIISATPILKKISNRHIAHSKWETEVFDKPKKQYIRPDYKE